MVGCSVVGCKTRSSVLDDVSFYKYPLDEALKEKWRIASGLTVSKLTKHQRMCSKHFTVDSFTRLGKKVGKKDLKRGSIPTLNVHRLEGPENTEDDVNMNVRYTKRNIMTNKGTKRKQDDDIEVVIVNSNSDVELTDAYSETECIITDTVTDAETEYLITETEIDAETECLITDTETDAAVNTLVGQNIVSPEIRKLIFKLQRKAQVAESQKKTVARLRGTVFRLRKKNKELTATIEIMKNEALKDHKGPSILLVGM